MTYRWMRPGATLALAAILSAPGCGVPDRSAGARDEDRIRDVALGIMAADNERDLDRVLAHYTDNAVLFPPNHPPVRGKEAIKPRYEALFREYAPQTVARINEMQVAENWALVIGSISGELRPLATSPPLTLDDVYWMLLKRDSVGEWRIAQLIWHAASEPGSRKPAAEQAIDHDHAHGT